MNLCQYIARHPVSLKKITYVKEKGKVFNKTKYNDYFKENVKLFNVLDFIANLTIHIPPKGKHLIRYYGLYSSRSKGKNKENGINDKFGVKASEIDEKQSPDEIDNVESVSSKKSKQTWAKLIQKIYEVDPYICPKCQSEMKIIAVITEYDEIQKILSCLKKNKSPLFDKKTILGKLQLSFFHIIIIKGEKFAFLKKHLPFFMGYLSFLCSFYYLSDFIRILMI